MPHRGFRKLQFVGSLVFVTVLGILSLAPKSYATCVDEGAGNTPDTATLLIVPVSKNGSLCQTPEPEKWYDWYQISTTTGSRVKITLKNLEDDLDLIVWNPTATGVEYQPMKPELQEESADFDAKYTSYKIQVMEGVLDPNINTGRYTLEINYAPPPGTVGCNQVCTQNADCETNYCHPTEHRCRNGTEGCQASDTCTCPTPACTNPIDCKEKPTDNLCTVDACENPGLPTAFCKHTPKNCNDTNYCTEDICQDGLCQNNTIVCVDDGDPCTSATCTPSYNNPSTGNGCHKPLPPVNAPYYCTAWGPCSSTSCTDDGNPIPGTETCTAATCNSSCGGICTGTNPTGVLKRGCEPVCPYGGPGWRGSPNDYRTICDNPDWYKGDPNLLGLICVIVRLLNVFVLSVGGIFVMFVFISAIKYGLAQGDPKALQGAKQTLTLAIIGMLVVIGVFTILTILRNIFGLQYQILTNPFDVLSDRLATLMKQMNIRWNTTTP